MPLTGAQNRGVHPNARTIATTAARDLDRQRDDQQHIVARNAQYTGARNRKHCGKEQTDEQAGACFLDAEIQELNRVAGNARVRVSSGWIEETGVEGE